jgi:hypothetical protein
MLGSNPSAGSVASTDSRGCYGIPFSPSARRSPASGEAPRRKILGVRGQSPCKLAPATNLPSEARAPSHNA